MVNLCKKAYKAAIDDVVDSDEKASDSSKFKDTDIWKFCTSVEFKPKTVEEAAKKVGRDKTESESGGAWSDSKLGSAKKADLLAIYTKENGYAWEILDEQFSKDKPVNSFFSKSSIKGSSIKWRCEDAYKEDTTGSDDSKPTEADLYKWCSLKGRKTS